MIQVHASTNMDTTWFTIYADRTFQIRIKALSLTVSCLVCYHLIKQRSKVCWQLFEWGPTTENKHFFFLNKATMVGPRKVNWAQLYVRFESATLENTPVKFHLKLLWQTRGNHFFCSKWMWHLCSLFSVLVKKRKIGEKKG